MTDRPKNLTSWKKVSINFEDCYYDLHAISLHYFNNNHDQTIDWFYTGLQDTVGVMQKFREEQLKERKRLLEEENKEIAGELMAKKRLTIIE